MLPSSSPLSFPILDDVFAPSWQWPQPPFNWRHVEPPDLATAQACRIDAARGVSVDGTMLGFDAPGASLRFESPTTGRPGTLFFKRFRRLTLIAPLVPSALAAAAPLEAVPTAAQERDYHVTADDGEPALTGRTVGHVETPEGLFLFSPVEGERALQRVFIPRCAYTACRFGRSAHEIAAERWITTPDELLAAIEHQRGMPVHRIGQSLIDLGLVTPEQIERALAGETSDVPLGERLVGRGIISRADLQTALAHKMGYPLVDLEKFPIDALVSALLPRDMALRYKALPLMTDRDRLIVAVDRPQRLTKLQALSKFSVYKLVAVLASKHEIMLALARATQRDPWFVNVAARPGFFATTV
ncbi:MAG: hypothetical protein ABIX46_10780 [Burkholderiaceae bacterium]